MSFKFDFSPAVGEGGDDDSANSSCDLRGRLIADANETIEKLVERSKKNAGACTLVNASSKILSVDNDNRESKTSGDDEFRPNLRFHPHESIDLCSSKMDRLRYVIPKHTISDDTTDLIPGVYEGGLKVWECSVDLCRFLARVIDDLSIDATSSATSDADLDVLRGAVRRSLGPGGSTMELGCGHGLPGCLILRENIRKMFKQDKKVNGTANSDDNSVVIFTDFNDFVLHHATIPNAQLNVCGLRGEDGVAMDEFRTAKALVERSIFAGGDWMGISHKLSSGNCPLPVALHQNQEEGNRLDLILASETTYTPESCQDTAFLMLRHLKIDDGAGLVATKRFYFGVGGGTDLFKAACETLSMSDQGPYSGLRLCVRTVQSYDTGNANIRDLLFVTLHQKVDGKR
eukprot:CAMPEP_0201893358 /NCGR_PEP_ID=MMETSP0902-20130614/38466_1 /ASSEMBLY_ACC=CAM_ASM_000551 /TAXON_ID=420261 /ORGANISM="Thalassiosira antarctica, Strain CCMP982" /LENGTH=401 /DNA_ID=CAMNT_0048425113 /DNA_START=18 /DNA_END=1223 /DNA_ORIENTATION=-